MIEISLAQMRNPRTLFSVDDIVRIIDGRKKIEMGFFVPKNLKSEFEAFLAERERQKKRNVLERVARAQRADPVEEGGIDEGL